MLCGHCTHLILTLLLNNSFFNDWNSVVKMTHWSYETNNTSHRKSKNHEKQYFFGYSSGEPTTHINGSAHRRGPTLTHDRGCQSLINIRVVSRFYRTNKFSVLWILFPDHRTGYMVAWTIPLWCPGDDARMLGLLYWLMV